MAETRDTLRQLEDEEVRTKQAIVDKKILPNLEAYLFLVRVLIKQQRQIKGLTNLLSEKETNNG